MTVTAHGIARSPRWRGRWLLIFVEVVVAVNAVGGAVYGLAGAKDVPREWLDGTPFHSYVIPSLVLLIAVGGSMGAAALALLTRYRYAPELSVVAGVVLAGWITMQVALIVPDGGFSWLQPTMFAAGLLVVALGWRLRAEHDMTKGRRHVDAD